MSNELLGGKRTVPKNPSVTAAVLRDDGDKIMLTGVVLDAVEGIAISSCATSESTIGHK